MALDLSGSAGEDLWLARKQLGTDGYLVASDDELGLPGARLRAHLLRTYFTPDVLRRYPGDIPDDRERARDVVEYAWEDGVPALTEHPEIAIEDRGGRPERREYARTPVAHDPLFASWIRAALSLIPEDRRRRRGTFGVNIFRTFTNVVTRPHADGEEFVFVYVVAREGSGAETTLFQPGDPATPVHSQRLEPGQLIVFEDARFLHTASPLIAPAGGRARRDALVCTVDYPQTYGLG
ncbi:2OG-Fe dioxygenase family protein [Amycolatopsis sp. NPDC021455]|uniref:2OG-Fe dioxygenase family protein n=1 Tax=Amycolatopsis sp. NPDC021455 TaxID=3154901 RepID=UPI0033D3472C